VVVAGGNASAGGFLGFEQPDTRKRQTRKMDSTRFFIDYHLTTC
jgi:hypothetical protein